MKTEQTKIPVEIQTDYTHEQGNELEAARQQIELSSFYLQSLFNSIKHLASDLESKVEEKETEYCYDLRNLADIGYSVGNSIFAAVSIFETAENDTRQNTESAIVADAESETRQPESVQSIAQMISHLITSEKVPTPISDGVSQVMIDFFNEHIDQTEFNDEANSPAHIERLLRAYKDE
jgi:hypothetical protein